MPERAESSRGRLAGRGIVVALAVLVAMPAYLTLSPAWRPAAVRVVCALLVAGGCARALRSLREAAGPRPVSPLDAPPAAPPALAIDERFAGLRDDLVSGTRSRRYFDVILWPRLRNLAGRDLPKPPERRGLLRRRGPSLRAIEDLVAEVERGA